MKHGNEIEIVSYIFAVHNPANTDRWSLNVDRQELLNKLQHAGFSVAKIEMALDWLTSLAQQQMTEHDLNEVDSVRIFAPEEIAKIGEDNLTFITILEDAEILNPATREIVLNQLLLLKQDDISLTEVKLVAFMVLVSQDSSVDISTEVQRYALLLASENIDQEERT